MKKSLTLAAALTPLATLPAFAHTDGTAHVHSIEGLAWAIGIGLVAGLAYFVARGRR